jgi:hypothetical protein
MYKNNIPNFYLTNVNDYNKNIIVSGFDTNNYNPQTIIYNRNNIIDFKKYIWNDTTKGQYIYNDFLYRINLYGNISKIDLKNNIKIDDYSLKLDPYDFITCFEYDENSNYKILCTFLNNIYIINEKNDIKVFKNYTSFETNKFANKIKIFNDDGKGPLIMVIQFMEGDYVFLKFLLLHNQIQILENYKIKLPTKSANILDYIILNYGNVWFLGGAYSKNRILLNFHFKTFDINFKIFYKDYIKIHFDSNNNYYLFNKKNLKWDPIDYSNLFTNNKLLD